MTASVVKAFWSNTSTSSTFFESNGVLDHGDSVEFRSVLWRDDDIINQGNAFMSREEAISAARAILKHFNETDA